MMSWVILLMLPALVKAQMCEYSGDVYDQNMNRCYHFPDLVVGVEAAERYCTNIGYNLVSIHNEAQNKLLIEYAEQKFYGYCQNECTFYTGGSRHYDQFRWSDGTWWNYHNWNFGEPLYDTMIVDVNSGYWYTSNEGRSLNFICQGNPSTVTRDYTQSTWPYNNDATSAGTTEDSWNYPTSPEPMTPSTPEAPSPDYPKATRYNWPYYTSEQTTSDYPYYPGSTQNNWPYQYTTSTPGWGDWTTPSTTCNTCQSGWTYFDEQSACYSTLFASNWDSARFLCREIGAELVSIHSYGENAFVARLTQTGMTATNVDQQTWIGLNYESGLWRWSDGSRIDFINWAPREPVNTYTQKCVTIAQDSESLYWQTADCGTKMRIYVCKKPVNH